MAFYDTLAGFYPSALLVPEEQRKFISEVIFCWRAGKESLVVAFMNSDALAATAPSAPQDVLSRLANRYAVDLDSLGTDRERFYVDDPNSDTVSIRGWYYDNGVQTESKEYLRDGRGTLAVQRYTPAGTATGVPEGEVTGTDIHWRGRRAVLEFAQAEVAAEDAAGYFVLTKLASNQCYLRLFGI